MIKASAGGGGRGMRVVRNAEELPGLMAQAQNEAAAAFSNGDLVHGEAGRESAPHRVSSSRGPARQRRSPGRARVFDSAAASEINRRIAFDGGYAGAAPAHFGQLEEGSGKIGYTNAGTVEFLMGADGNLHFIEVNARIQVEHPVTEFVTGVDLVKAQIRIANGENLERYSGSAERRRNYADTRSSAALMQSIRRHSHRRRVRSQD